MTSTPACTSVLPREAPKLSVTRGLTCTGETKGGRAAGGETVDSGPETAPSPAAGVGRAMVGVGAGVRVEVGAYATAAWAWVVGVAAASDGCVASDPEPEPGSTTNTTAETSASAPPATVVANSHGRRDEPCFDDADSKRR
jgi:hypothetical protein